MKIYLDYIFLENFITNLIIIYQISIFCKIKFLKSRSIICNIILSLYSVLINTLDNSIIESFLIKFILIFSSIYICYKPENLSAYIKYFLYYLMFYFIYIGIVIFIAVFFNIKLNIFCVRIILYILSGLILLLINKLMWKMWKNNIKNKIVYKVNLNNFSFKAFVDTGNNVKDTYNNVDVIFVSSSLKEKILENNNFIKTTEMNISTATCNQNMEGYIFNNVSIYDECNKVIRLKKAEFIFIDSTLFNEKEYSGLISYDTYIEKLKGDTLC